MEYALGHKAHWKSSWTKESLVEFPQALSLMLPCIIIISSAQKLIVPQICFPPLPFTFPARKILIYSLFLFWWNSLNKIHCINHFNVYDSGMFSTELCISIARTFLLTPNSIYSSTPKSDACCVCYDRRQSPVIHAALSHLHTDLRGWKLVHF